ncbi:hypothetical protein LXL04_033772 [Taraxacum kok-saghyz]
MGSYYHSSDYCFDIVQPVYDGNRSSSGQFVNLTNQNIESLWYFCLQIFYLEVQGKYSGPMAWIGIYISIASLFCILAMIADLFNGFKKRKFWFPSKYFSLNAVSITVIVVAMKLPVDLSSAMPGWVDQAAKQGSLVFMCMMMANLMPSLASMDNKSLVANVIGFVILIITIIVNMFIEINTGVIEGEGFSLAINKWTFNEPHFMDVGYIYVAFLLFLLMILISSTITLPISKQILELKYQAIRKETLYDHCPQDTFSIEKLRQHVKIYWIMAETGSPQFVMASNSLSCATGIFYTHIVEASLNNTPQYINIQKATMTLWDEVEGNYKWLENTLEKRVYEGKTSREILEWFAHKAEEIMIEVSKSMHGGEPVEYLPRKLIVANSMYRITQTIMLTYQNILLACFTNIPRVITMKCQESAIEKREASVEAAAKLLGRSNEIIKRLEVVELPSIDHDKMAYIDEWRLHLRCIP